MLNINKIAINQVLTTIEYNQIKLVKVRLWCYVLIFKLLAQDPIKPLFKIFDHLLKTCENPLIEKPRGPPRNIIKQNNHLD